VSALFTFVALSLRERRRRIIGLVAFGLVFLAAGATARLVTGREHGHMELDVLFELGGTTLVSALLLLAWFVGRFAVIAALVLLSGVFSADRAAGFARLFAVRPRSLLLLYAARWTTLCLLAFIMAATLMAAFDWLVLGEWIGFNVFVLVAAQIIVFGTVTALLSMVSRADAWLALFLGLLAMVWDGLRRIDFFQNAAPAVRETVSVVLPPQGALMRMETAFGAMQPVPWDAFVYILLYGTLVLLIAGVALTRREL
jgi:hypothetical protein